MSSILFVATSALFVGIVGVVIFLAVVVGGLGPPLAKHQARARITSEARAQARRTRNDGRA